MPMPRFKHHDSDLWPNMLLLYHGGARTLFEEIKPVLKINWLGVTWPKKIHTVGRN